MACNASCQTDDDDVRRVRLQKWKVKTMKLERRRRISNKCVIDRMKCSFSLGWPHKFFAVVIVVMVIVLCGWHWYFKSDYLYHLSFGKPHCKASSHWVERAFSRVQLRNIFLIEKDKRRKYKMSSFTVDSCGGGSSGGVASLSSSISERG